MPSHFKLMIIREIEKRNKRKIPYISILEFLIKRDKKNEILLKFSFDYHKKNDKKSFYMKFLSFFFLLS